MNIELKLAKPEKKELVVDFYYDAIDHMEGMEYHPAWIKDVYPDRPYLYSAVENGQLYLAVDGEEILGGLILTHHGNEEYEKAAWSIKAAPEETIVVHTLTVHPKVARQGVGKQMVQQMIQIAKEMGCKTIRLDVIEGNLPAVKLYAGQGFTYVERQVMYYEDTGWTNFDLYEYII